jgi:hypothetical protein
MQTLTLSPTPNPRVLAGVLSYPEVSSIQVRVQTATALDAFAGVVLDTRSVYSAIPVSAAPAPISAQYPLVGTVDAVALPGYLWYPGSNGYIMQPWTPRTRSAARYAWTSYMDYSITFSYYGPATSQQFLWSDGTVTAIPTSAYDTTPITMTQSTNERFLLGVTLDNVTVDSSTTRYDSLPGQFRAIPSPT